jgi:MinD-like ATPase involved in chromosome partitioning or flagellar assembly
MTRGLALMRRHFQYVVFDGPPVLPVSDAAIVATQVDGVVLVVDGTLNATHAAKARNLLRSVKAKLLGAVVNKAQDRAVGLLPVFGLREFRRRAPVRDSAVGAIPHDEEHCGRYSERSRRVVVRLRPGGGLEQQDQLDCRAADE